MFERDGIVYAGEPVQGICVAEAEHVGEGCLLVTFSTGEIRLFDASEVWDIPVFEALKSDDVLSDFKIDRGVLTWLGGDVDISPEALYERSRQYEKIA